MERLFISALTIFDNQKYLNLETFRMSCVGVKTPVWFVQDGEVLFVCTAVNSGKVKRICHNHRMNIAACKMAGRLCGDWVPALAREVTDPEIDRKADQLLSKKYGLLKKLFFGGGSNVRKYTLLEMKVRE